MFKLISKNLKIENGDKKKFVFKLFFLSCLILFGIFASQNAQAATSYFSPSSGNFTVGNIFTVNVLVNTEGVAINNAEATINFPSSLLEIVSISKSGSIFSLWVEEPTFSNGAGTLSFNGGLPTPGFNGTAGKVLGAVFRVKKEGSASLVFSSAAVRANDGYGTDVFKSGAQAIFNLISEGKPLPPTEEKLPPAPIIGGVPEAPQVSSPTHPDPEKWYSNDNPEFTWKLSSDITSVRLLYDKYSTSRPSVIYKPPISEKQLENIKDGIWYFHVQFSNVNGWGEISHFRFQIDTEKPDRFDIREIMRNDLTDPKVKFAFDASDKTSGIDHYEVQIDNGNSQIWQDDGSHIYKTSALPPGRYTLIAKAVDKAGNVLASSAEFTIEGLQPPEITEYPSTIQSGEPLIVKGKTAYPNSEVVVWLQREKDEPKSQSVKADQSGKFTFVADERLSGGIYKLWVEVIDMRGAKSNPSEPVTIAVEQPAFLKIGSWAVSLLAVVVPLVALIFILLFIIWYGWHKFASFRKKLKNLRKEVREAESALHKAFDMLKEDIRDQVKLLEKTRTKRQLTEEEDKIIKQLRKDLDDAERFVRKEIEDIEKAVK